MREAELRRRGRQMHRHVRREAKLHRGCARSRNAAPRKVCTRQDPEVLTGRPASRRLAGTDSGRFAARAVGSGHAEADSASAWKALLNQKSVAVIAEA